MGNNRGRCCAVVLITQKETTMNVDETLLREPSNQSSANIQFLEEIAQYWHQSQGDVNVKLENFTKYISRESLTKFLARSEVFLKQINVHGSIVELGVARGSSLMTWFHLSSIYEPYNYSREIIGFDTFKGIPKLDKKDTSSDSISVNVKVGGFSVESKMKDDIEKSTKIHDLTRPLGHIKKLKLVEGDISETLPMYLDNNPHLIVSLLHIDVDVYQPAKIGLELLIPRMPKGGVIIFDEINSGLFPGETEALKDVLGLNSFRLCRFSYCPGLSYAFLD